MPIISFAPTQTIKSADVNANFSGLANGSLMTAPTVDSPTFTTKFVATGLYNNGNSGASPTINAANGDRQVITISAAATLSFTGFVAGQIVTIIIKENATGGFSVTLPSGKWSYGAVGTFDTTANAINILSVMYDGTNYYYQLAPSFS